MDFGAVIKRSWEITWRYKALWVLGIFAGVSGCSGSSGSGGNGGGGNSGGSGGSGLGDMGRFWDNLESYLPVIIGLGVLFFFIGLVWWIFSIAARGGLITGVNAIEDGATRPLGELWRSGFARFWPLFGIDVMLSLPMVALGLLMAVFTLGPLAVTLIRGGEPGPELIAPVCGSLAIGLPLLLVGGFVFGILRLLAQRFVMIAGHGAVESIGNSWHLLRGRLKDTAIMWLLNAALNLAASVVLAIPAFIIGVAVAIPIVTAIASDSWRSMVAIIPVAIVLFALIGIAYNGIWGTYTSALWTLFFRQMHGMGPAVPAGYGWQQAPSQPYPYQAPQPSQGEWPPPAPPIPAASPDAPPIAGWEPPAPGPEDAPPNG